MKTINKALKLSLILLTVYPAFHTNWAYAETAVAEAQRTPEEQVIEIIADWVANPKFNPKEHPYKTACTIAELLENTQDEVFMLVAQIAKEICKKKGALAIGMTLMKLRSVLEDHLKAKGLVVLDTPTLKARLDKALKLK